MEALASLSWTTGVTANAVGAVTILDYNESEAIIRHHTQITIGTFLWDVSDTSWLPTHALGSHWPVDCGEETNISASTHHSLVGWWPEDKFSHGSGICEDIPPLSTDSRIVHTYEELKQTRGWEKGGANRGVTTTQGNEDSR